MGSKDLYININMARELGTHVSRDQVAAAVKLLDQGATVPFIARYRKEITGGLDDAQLRTLSERLPRIRALEERKAVVLASIEEQGKLKDKLRRQILACTDRTTLEDLYLPYRPRRRTKATMAREKGLEPLAKGIRDLINRVGAATSPARAAALATHTPLLELARPFLFPDKGVNTAEEALEGASHILAEQIAETPQNRAMIRKNVFKQGVITATVKEEYQDTITKYDTWRGYTALPCRIASHAWLAMERGEAEGVLTVNIKAHDEEILTNIGKREIPRSVAALPPGKGGAGIHGFLEATIKDAYTRLMRESLIREVKATVKERADKEAVEVFAQNLRDLLMTPPAGPRTVLALDPGLRTGCKVAVLDQTGQVIDHGVIYPIEPGPHREKAFSLMGSLIVNHRVELIGIGNGTGSRETTKFVDELLDLLEKTARRTLGGTGGGNKLQLPTKVIVNEAGASVYSASELASTELPHLDVTIRGAVSIGRRLQDPLAELVKIDPRSIGIGQYQHGVDKRLLQSRLEGVVEDCVNLVGVDVNTASPTLLSHVVGIGPAIANNIVAWRNSNGPFRRRQELLKVPRLGPKAFEQAAGFLRIHKGDNPLDASAVHPESYPVVERMAARLGMEIRDLIGNQDALNRLNPREFIDHRFGLPTVEDIVQELAKPGRDPRAAFQYAVFRDDVREPADLRPGMELQGTVTNVVAFGAFVDVGVHQDGLVHISMLADHFVRHPSTVVSVGQVVNVRVVSVDLERNRIALSMKKKP